MTEREIMIQHNKFIWENLLVKTKIGILKEMPRTVWVFGAGASRHYELNSLKVPMPLSRDFLRYALNSRRCLSSITLLDI